MVGLCSPRTQSFRSESILRSEKRLRASSLVSANTKQIIWARVFCVLWFTCLIAAPARADQITSVYGTTVPLDAWSYSKLENVGQGFSTTYIPTRGDYGSAPFVGYVITPDNGAWGGAEFFGEDTIYVFRTTLTANTDLVVPLQVNGDDGHSVYVNNSLLGSGGFAVPVPFDVILSAGVPLALEIAIYNGPGPWVLELRRRDNGASIASVPGLQLEAAAQPKPVPEPNTMMLLVTGVAGLVGRVYRSRR